MEYQILILLGALLLIAWMVADLSRNKLSRCPKCKGSGQLPSTFFANRYRPCPRCKRSGEIGR